MFFIIPQTQFQLSRVFFKYHFHELTQLNEYFLLHMQKQAYFAVFKLFLA